MTKTLLASAAMIFAITTTSFATAPVQDILSGLKMKVEDTSMEAKRRKPRIPGGSGCDTPRDVAEHPECRTGTKKKASMQTLDFDNLIQEAKRRKPRVPGGSGCDTPKDVAKYPECRV